MSAHSGSLLNMLRLISNVNPLFNLSVVSEFTRSRHMVSILERQNFFSKFAVVLLCRCLAFFAFNVFYCLGVMSSNKLDPSIKEVSDYDGMCLPFSFFSFSLLSSGIPNIFQGYCGIGTFIHVSFFGCSACVLLTLVRDP